MTVVALTGTPGTGKTTASLAMKKHGWKVLDLNRAIVSNRLYTGKDMRRKSFIADMRAVGQFVRNKTEEGNWIIASHLSHLLSDSVINVVIVLRCQPDVLRKRLKLKKWSLAKIDENVEAEMISLISSEARERHKKVYDIDTTKCKKTQVVVSIDKVLKGSGKRYKTAVEWLK